MKKIVSMLGVVLLLLTSCSSDSNTDETENNSDEVLFIKKLTNNHNTQFLISYEGSKIIKAQTSNYSSNYTYDGNVIIKVEDSDADYLTSTDYIYENDKLKTTVIKENMGNGTPLKERLRKEYTYNTNGTITVKTIGYSDGITSTIITFQNGNMVKEEQFDDKGEIKRTLVHEYDINHNPYINILGFDKLMDAQQSSKNNIIKTTRTNYWGSSVSTYVVTNDYTYNTQGYPELNNITEINYYEEANQTTDSYTAKYEY